jgi:hypothetical protein
MLGCYKVVIVNESFKITHLLFSLLAWFAVNSKTVETSVFLVSPILYDFHSNGSDWTRTAIGGGQWCSTGWLG